MKINREVGEDLAFGSYPYERYSNMNASGKQKDYGRAKLRNWSTGEREEIELFDINDESNEDYLAEDPKLELKTDVRLALKAFSPIEQRIIIRTLVQGQSIEEATKNMKHGREKWRVWLQEKALPKLRELLADYEQKGKVVLS